MCRRRDTSLESQQSPISHEIPGRRNVDSAIHFVFFGFNSGRKRPIQFHSHPTSLAYISRHGFSVHTMGSDFLLPVDRKSVPFVTNVLLRNYPRKCNYRDLASLLETADSNSLLHNNCNWQVPRFN